MKTRFAELTIDECNKETRPFNRIYQYQFDFGRPVTIVIEYLDMDAYKAVYTPALERHIAEGWAVVDHDVNQTGAYFILRRVRPATESAADE